MNYFRLDGNIAILNSYKKFHSAVIVFCYSVVQLSLSFFFCFLFLVVMLFYFHFFTLFLLMLFLLPLFYVSVVSTLLWFPPSRGFHLSMVSTLCGYSVVCTLLLFASSRGYLWCPFCGFHFSGLHSAVGSTLPWFASLHGSHPPCGYSVVSLSWFVPSHGLHSAMVSTLLWFASSHGSHPLMVTPWCPSWLLA